MLSVRLLVGRMMPASAAVTGGTLMSLLLMRTNPRRNSLTSVGEKTCVSVKREDSILHRKLVGKVEISAADAAAQRGCQAARAKGHVRLEVLKKEIDRQLVLGVTELAIPGCGELVIGVDARDAGGKRDHSTGSSVRWDVGQRITDSRWPPPQTDCS